VRGRKPGKKPPMNLRQFAMERPPGQLAAPHTPIKGKKLPIKKPRKSQPVRRPPPGAF
jgi:hypothetical protein